MAADKDADTKKDVEPKKDAATGEKPVEFIVDGMTEEELKRVSGGLGGVVVIQKPLGCEEVICGEVRSKCYTYCNGMECTGVTCKDHKCTNFGFI